MENFKVYVKNAAESGSVQELLSNLGFKWMSGDDRVYFDTPNYIIAWEGEGKSMTVGDVRDSKIKEVTIDKLCDLVDSKKNSENGKEMNILDEWRYVEKEYINKTTGEYRKTADVVSGEQWIEVPEGATKLIHNKGNNYLYHFINNDGFLMSVRDMEDDSGQWYEDTANYAGWVGSVVIWQRPSQPEALLFVDDEPSLNDQYAEIEKVRQAIKVKSGSDSDHGVDAMSFGCIGLVEPRENNHYFINVSDVDEVDFYEIAKRYNVTDPAIQHILKKCLAIGNRGHKDLETDLNDILKTAKRALTINGFKVKGESK